MEEPIGNTEQDPALLSGEPEEQSLSRRRTRSPSSSSSGRKPGTKTRRLTGPPEPEREDWPSTPANAPPAPKNAPPALENAPAPGKMRKAWLKAKGTAKGFFPGIRSRTSSPTAANFGQGINYDGAGDPPDITGFDGPGDPPPAALGGNWRAGAEPLQGQPDPRDRFENQKITKVPLSKKLFRQGLILQVPTHQCDIVEIRAATDMPFEVSENKKYGRIYSKNRRVIVIGLYEHHYVCLPLRTFGGRGFHAKREGVEGGSTFPQYLVTLQDPRPRSKLAERKTQLKPLMAGRIHEGIQSFHEYAMVDYTSPISRYYAEPFRIDGFLTQESIRRLATLWTLNAPSYGGFWEPPVIPKWWNESDEGRPSYQITSSSAWFQTQNVYPVPEVRSIVDRRRIIDDCWAEASHLAEGIMSQRAQSKWGGSSAACPSGQAPPGGSSGPAGPWRSASQGQSSSSQQPGTGPAGPWRPSSQRPSSSSQQQQAPTQAPQSGASSATPPEPDTQQGQEEQQQGSGSRARGASKLFQSWRGRGLRGGGGDSDAETSPGESDFPLDTFDTRGGVEDLGTPTEGAWKSPGQSSQNTQEQGDFALPEDYGTLEAWKSPGQTSQITQEQGELALPEKIESLDAWKLHGQTSPNIQEQGGLASAEDMGILEPKEEEEQRGNGSEARSAAPSSESKDDGPPTASAFRSDDWWEETHPHVPPAFRKTLKEALDHTGEVTFGAFARDPALMERDREYMHNSYGNEICEPDLAEFEQTLLGPLRHAYEQSLDQWRAHRKGNNPKLAARCGREALQWGETMVNELDDYVQGHGREVLDRLGKMLEVPAAEEVCYGLRAERYAARLESLTEEERKEYTDNVPEGWLQRSSLWRRMFPKPVDGGRDRASTRGTGDVCV